MVYDYKLHLEIRTPRQARGNSQIDEIKEYDNDVRYLIGVPIPQGGTAFIFSMKNKNEFEYVGNAVLVPSRAEEE